MILFWRSVPLRKSHRLPRKPGLYAVRWLFLTFYVGKSVDINGRWRDHHRYPQAARLPWCRIAYRTMHKHAIHDAERRLIRATKSPWSWNGEPVPSRAYLRFRDVLDVCFWVTTLVGIGVLVVSFAG